MLLASQAPVGVIFRRGPSKSVCSIGWNLKTDEFTLGQWLRGRIYERRADISPDGRYLIYFAMNGKWSSKTRGSWTAVSRTPWLKAIVLHAKGDCWFGGGLFTSNTSYWLNGGCSEVIEDSAEVRRESNFKPVGGHGGECPSIYYPRLLRDGWTLRTRIDNGRFNGCTVFEKVASQEGLGFAKIRARGNWLRRPAKVAIGTSTNSRTSRQGACFRFPIGNGRTSGATPCCGPKAAAFASRAVICERSGRA